MYDHDLLIKSTLILSNEEQQPIYADVNEFFLSQYIP